MIPYTGPDCERRFHNLVVAFVCRERENTDRRICVYGNVPSGKRTLYPHNQSDEQECRGYERKIIV